jgi:hypothetical protein
MQTARNHTESTRLQKLTVAHIAKKYPASSKPKCSLNMLISYSVLPLFLKGVPKTDDSDRASTIVHCTKGQVINGHGVPTAGLLGKHSYILLLQMPQLHCLKVVLFSATSYHLFRSWIHFVKLCSFIILVFSFTSFFHLIFRLPASLAHIGFHSYNFLTILSFITRFLLKYLAT